MKNKILSAVIFLIVEAIIVTIMLMIPVAEPLRVRVLDICVLTVIWMMFSYDLFRPLVNSLIKNAPEYGSLGVRWGGQSFYLIASLALIIAGVLIPIVFFWQLLGQIALFSILLLTFLYASKASQLVTEVAAEQEKVLAGRQQMRDAVRAIQDEIAVASYPDELRTAVNDIEEKLRYISPSSISEAIKYEQQFAEVAQRICTAMSTNYAMNEESINQDILRLNRIIENRKNVRG